MDGVMVVTDGERGWRNEAGSLFCQFCCHTIQFKDEKRINVVRKQVPRLADRELIVFTVRWIWMLSCRAGNGSIGQMGHNFWVGHMAHGSPVR